MFTAHSLVDILKEKLCTALPLVDVLKETLCTALYTLWLVDICIVQKKNLSYVILSCSLLVTHLAACSRSNSG